MPMQSVETFANRHLNAFSMHVGPADESPYSLKKDEQLVSAQSEAQWPFQDNKVISA